MKRIFYLFLFLFLAANASAQIDFSNSVLSGDYPVAKNRIDSIINNSDYVFEGKVIDIKMHPREIGKRIRSYLFQIEFVYKGGNKIKGGTIELLVPYPRIMPQDTTPAGFLINDSYILFCKNTPIKGIYNTSNETKLELFYSSNYIFSFFKELTSDSYNSNNNIISGTQYYNGFDCLYFQNKENLNAFLQSYALTPKAALQTRALKTEVYPELLKYYPIEKKESDTIHAKARAADSIKLIQLLDSIHKIKQSKPKEEKDRFLNTLNIPDSIKRYMQVKDSIYREKQVKKLKE